MIRYLDINYRGDLLKLLQYWGIDFKLYETCDDDNRVVFNKEEDG